MTVMTEVSARRTRAGHKLLRSIFRRTLSFKKKKSEDRFAGYKGVRDITIKKGPSGLGIMIIEGRHTEAGRGIFVSDLQEGSAAEQAGLQIGDMILAVNRDSLLSCSYDGAAAKLKQTEGVVVLTVCSPNMKTDDAGAATPGAFAVTAPAVTSARALALQRYAMPLLLHAALCTVPSPEERSLSLRPLSLRPVPSPVKGAFAVTAPAVTAARALACQRYATPLLLHGAPCTAPSPVTAPAVTAARALACQRYATPLLLHAALCTAPSPEERSLSLRPLSLRPVPSPVKGAFAVTAPAVTAARALALQRYATPLLLHAALCTAPSPEERSLSLRPLSLRPVPSPVKGTPRRSYCTVHPAPRPLLSLRPLSLRPVPSPVKGAFAVTAPAVTAARALALQRYATPLLLHAALCTAPSPEERSLSLRPLSLRPVPSPVKGTPRRSYCTVHPAPRPLLSLRPLSLRPVPSPVKGAVAVTAPAVIAARALACQRYATPLLLHAALCTAPSPEERSLSLRPLSLRPVPSPVKAEPPPDPATAPIVPNQECVIELPTTQPLGVVLLGGSDTLINVAREFCGYGSDRICKRILAMHCGFQGGGAIILDIYKGGAASADGRLQPGDQLRECNGTPLTEAMAHERLCLTIRRKAPKFAAVEAELGRKAGRALGLTAVQPCAAPAVYLGDPVRALPIPAFLLALCAIARGGGGGAGPQGGPRARAHRRAALRRARRLAAVEAELGRKAGRALGLTAVQPCAAPAVYLGDPVRALPIPALLLALCAIARGGGGGAGPQGGPRARAHRRAALRRARRLAAVEAELGRKAGRALGLTAVQPCAAPAVYLGDPVRALPIPALLLALCAIARGGGGGAGPQGGPRARAHRRAALRRARRLAAVEAELGRKAGRALGLTAVQPCAAPAVYLGDPVRALPIPALLLALCAIARGGGGGAGPQGGPRARAHRRAALRRARRLAAVEAELGRKAGRALGLTAVQPCAAPAVYLGDPVRALPIPALLLVLCAIVRGGGGGAGPQGGPRARAHRRAALRRARRFAAVEAELGRKAGRALGLTAVQPCAAPAVYLGDPVRALPIPALLLVLCAIVRGGGGGAGPQGGPRARAHRRAALRRARRFAAVEAELGRKAGRALGLTAVQPCAAPAVYLGDPVRALPIPAFLLVSCAIARGGGGGAGPQGGPRARAHRRAALRRARRVPRRPGACATYPSLPARLCAIARGGGGGAGPQGGPRARLLSARLLPGSPVELDGRLQKGDLLVSVDGKDLSEADYMTVAAALKLCGNKVTIKVKRFKIVSLKQPIDRALNLSLIRFVQSQACIRGSVAPPVAKEEM
ncbi:hypothetical protein ACJJTC_004232 [Scirpophaga incertulas]